MFPSKLSFAKLPLALSVLAVGLAQPALAQTRVRAVVELFTSQGCSSCPPADRLLAELAREPDVLALSMPVDYWDYLGWKDTLANPAFSARQKAYAAVRGDRQVYTPQMIVNGKKSFVGSNRGEVDQLIARASKGRAELPVAVEIRETGNAVAVEVGAGASEAPKAGEVWVLAVTRAHEVAINRGENRGKSIVYANVVRGMIRAGAWTGAAARFSVPLADARPPGADGYVVLLQAIEPSRPGAVLGAAKGPGL